MRIWTSRKGRRESGELARRAEADAAETLREISSLRSSVDDLRRELIEVLAEQAPSRSSATSFALGVTALLVASLWMILHGTSGLREVSTSGSIDSGTVSVGVAVDAPQAADQILPFPPGTQIGVAASFETDDSVAFYRVFFPEEFVGKKFVLMLRDGAVFSRLVDDGTGRARDVAHQDCVEVGGQGATAFSIEHKCQLIYGTVPEVPNFEEALTDYIAPHSCSIAGLDNQITRPSVEIWGYLQFPMVARLDWAHQDVSYPAMLADPANATLREWDGVALDAEFGTVNQLACKVSDYPYDTKITDGNPAPSWAEHYSFGWEGEAALYQSSVVATRRDAGATANRFIAVGGLAAALAIGFLPMAYGRVIDSWRRRSRRHRS